MSDHLCKLEDFAAIRCLALCQAMKARGRLVADRRGWGCRGR